jgi:hypothetical protein
MSDGQARNYVPGDYYLVCDYSGFKIKRSEAKMTWDGFLVRKDFWEPRQPQDFVRGLRDKITVAPGQTRGESTNDFLTDNEVQPGDL